MNWIKRYVAEVKRYLPAGSRNDLGEEIESLLQEQAADREDSLGRSLTREEEFQLLKEFGHPVKLAAAYNASGVLISESLFPLYKLALKYLLALLSLVYLARLIWENMSGGHLVLPPAYLGNMLEAGFFWLVMLTLGFHLADRFLAKKDFLTNWNPAELPPAGAKTEAFSASLFVAVFIVAWMALLYALPTEISLDVLLGKTPDRVATFKLWLLLQALLTLPVYLLLMFRPVWTRSKRVAIVMADLCVVIGAIIALQIDAEVFRLVYPEISQQVDVAEMSRYLLAFWMIGVAIDLVVQAYRLLQDTQAAGVPESLT